MVAVVVVFAVVVAVVDAVVVCCVVSGAVVRDSVVTVAGSVGRVGMIADWVSVHRVYMYIQHVDCVSVIYMHVHVVPIQYSVYSYRVYYM